MTCKSASKLTRSWVCFLQKRPLGENFPWMNSNHFFLLNLRLVSCVHFHFCLVKNVSYQTLAAEKNSNQKPRVQQDRKSAWKTVIFWSVLKSSQVSDTACMERYNVAHVDPSSTLDEQHNMTITHNFMNTFHFRELS